MDARSAHIHLLHDLDRAAGISRSLQCAIDMRRAIVVDALSVDRPHVAREKLDFLASLDVPKHAAQIDALIKLARDMHRDSQL